jgi:predicted dehydrogenase
MSGTNDASSSPPAERALSLGLLAAARITTAAVVVPARLVDGVELTAVGARDLERARAAAEEWDVPVAFGSYAELIGSPDVDAVYIATPAALHERWTIAALEAGKDVLCEKPLASNAVEARRMVDAAVAADRLLMEAFHWRYHPFVAQMRIVLDSGRLGTIERLDASFDLPDGHIPRSDIRFELALGGGALMDLGCYCVQWVRWAVGEEPAVASATADCPVADVDGRLVAELVFPSGPTARISCSMIGPEAAPDVHLHVAGSSGRMLVTNPLAPQYGGRIVVETADGTDELPVDPSTTYEHQLRAFRDAVRTGVAPPTSGIDSIANMVLIDEIYIAAGLSPRPSLTDLSA